MCRNIQRGTQSKMASQLVGMEVSPSILQQLKVLTDRGDSEVFHRSEYKYNVYSIQIVMQIT